MTQNFKMDIQKLMTDLEQPINKPTSRFKFLNALETLSYMEGGNVSELIAAAIDRGVIVRIANVIHRHANDTHGPDEKDIVAESTTASVAKKKKKKKKAETDGKTETDNVTKEVSKLQVEETKTSETTPTPTPATTAIPIPSLPPFKHESFRRDSLLSAPGLCVYALSRFTLHQTSSRSTVLSQNPHLLADLIQFIHTLVIRSVGDVDVIYDLVAILNLLVDWCQEKEVIPHLVKLQIIPILIRVWSGPWSKRPSNERAATAYVSLRVYTMALLANLTSIPEGCEMLYNGGIVPIASEAIKKETDDDILFRGIQILVRLCQHSPTYKAAVLSTVGSFAHVLPLCTAGNETLKAAAKTLLVQFPIGEEARNGGTINLDNLSRTETDAFKARLLQLTNIQQKRNGQEPILKNVQPPSSAKIQVVDDACAACGKTDGTMSLCARCRGTQYCSKDCQVAHWKIHKPTCQAQAQAQAPAPAQAPAATPDPTAAPLPTAAS